MFGLGLSWINNPTATSTAAAKLDQDTHCLVIRRKMTSRHVCLVVLSISCLLLLVSSVALSVLYTNASSNKPSWRSLLLGYQNASDGHQALTAANADLRRDNERLTELSDWLLQQNRILNRTSTSLTAVNLDLSRENSELSERIVNLTNANVQLVQDHQSLVRVQVQLEAQTLNASRAIEGLVSANALKDEENRRLEQINGLLTDELDQLRPQNQDLREENLEFRDQVQNLNQQNLDLNLTLTRERQEVQDRERTRRDQLERTEEDLRSMREAYRDLDQYCPVVDPETRERSCRKCPAGWRIFESSCYFFSSRTLSWTSSRTWCRTHGGDLVVINSGPEQTFVFRGGSSDGVAVGDGGVVGGVGVTRFWVGLTDVEVEGRWIWVDGSPVTVRFWLSRPGLGAEPDDWRVQHPMGEDCGHLDTHEDVVQSWMDGFCETPYRWICERKV